MTTRREKERRQIRYADTKRAMENQEKSSFSWTSLKIPDEVRKRQFRFTEEKTYRLAVIPYIAGDKNLDCDEGEAMYKCRYFTHPNVGQSEQVYLCPEKTLNQACPICEDLKRQWKKHGFNKEQAQRNGYKQRELYNVLDLDAKKDGVKWFETAFHMMLGEMIYNKLAADASRPEGGMYQDFWHLGKEGYTLEVKVEQKTNPSNNSKYFKPINLEFVPRKVELSEDLLDEAICLDDLLWVREYEELQELWTGGSDEEEEEETEDEDTEEEEEEESPKKSSGRATSGKKDTRSSREEEEEQEEEEDSATADDLGLEVGDIVNWTEEDSGEQGEFEIKKISPDGTSLTLEGEDGEIHKGVAPSEVEKVETRDEEEDQEEEDEEGNDEEGNGVPKSSSSGKKTGAASGAVKPRATAKSPSDDDDLFDDGEDEEEEEEESEDEEQEEEDEEDEKPAPKKKGKKK